MTDSKPAYGLLIAKDIVIPMRDGVRLAGDIYHPARDGAPAPGRFPTILLRTSYDKAAQRYISTIYLPLAMRPDVLVF